MRTKRTYYWIGDLCPVSTVDVSTRRPRFWQCLTVRAFSKQEAAMKFTAYLNGAEWLEERGGVHYGRL